MDVFRFVLVVLLILLRDTNCVSYFISEKATNWTTASRNCELATPDILTLPTQIPLLQDAGIDEVWVGYYETRTALEYFGCTEKDNNVQKFEIRGQDPGQCLSVCGTKKVIGIFGNECYCLDIDTINDTYQNTMSSACDKSCAQLKGAACGGTATSTDDGVITKSYMSLYRFIDTVKTISKTLKSSNKCIWYDHRQEFRTQSCDKRYKFICGKDSSVWIQNNETGQLQYKSWIEATRLCFSNNTRPSTYINTRNLRSPFGKAQLWTGIVTTDVIFKYSNDPSYTQYADKYGYLRRENDIYTLQRIKTKDQKLRKSLCVTDPHSVGTIVGVTLAVVLVIAVVILVVFLRKCGVNVPLLKKGNPTQSPNTSRNNVGFALSEPGAEFQRNAYMTSQYEYTDIDLKTEENSAVQNVVGKPEYEHDYFVHEKQEEGPYDSTKPELQKSGQSTFNPYDKLCDGKESDYDHVGNTHGGISRRNASRSDDTCNTVSLWNSNLKTSKGASNYEYNMIDDTEDTYNHINLHKSKNGLSVMEKDYDAI